uniref:Uncharacterized protein n=1 Tax=Arundo donax TaxID=35708 RepID=A0A0A9DIL7_ARUDO
MMVCSPLIFDFRLCRETRTGGSIEQVILQCNPSQIEISLDDWSPLSQFCSNLPRSWGYLCLVAGLVDFEL